MGVEAALAIVAFRRGPAAGSAGQARLDQAVRIIPRQMRAVPKGGVMLFLILVAGLPVSPRAHSDMATAIL